MSVDVGEVTGVVAEAMGIHPTSHTPKTDSGADKMPTATEVGWCEGLFFWGGGLFGEHETCGVDGPKNNRGDR